MLEMKNKLLNQITEVSIFESQLKRNLNFNFHCWLCALHISETFLDHDNSAEKNREAAQQKSNFYVEQESSIFFPIFCNNFSVDDGLPSFQELLKEAYKKENEPFINKKAMGSYVAVHLGCLRFFGFISSFSC